MTLFMYAITLVIAPMVARYYAAGDMRRAQLVTSFCTWAGFIFSLGIFALFWFYGDVVMALFGPEYADGKLILLLLSAGLLIDAATGPTRIVMMMTGFEKQYVTLFGTIMIIGFIVQVAVIPFYGIVGAAVVNMVARIVAQTVIAVWSKRHIGLETSLAGIFFLRR